MVYAAYKVDRKRNIVWNCVVTATTAKDIRGECRATGVEEVNESLVGVLALTNQNVAPFEIWLVNANTGAVRFCRQSDCIDVLDTK